MVSQYSFDSYSPFGVYHMISALSALTLQTVTFLISAFSMVLSVVKLNGVCVLSTMYFVEMLSGL